MKKNKGGIMEVSLKRWIIVMRYEGTMWQQKSNFDNEASAIEAFDKYSKDKQSYAVELWSPRKFIKGGGGCNGEKEEK